MPAAAAPATAATAARPAPGACAPRNTRRPSPRPAPRRDLPPRCAARPPQCAIYGNFSAPKAQELVVARGHTLELLRPNDSGKLVTVASTDVFGCVRSLAAFRLTGASRDYVIMGSDSGRIVILDYKVEKGMFVKVRPAHRTACCFGRGVASVCRVGVGERQ